MTEIQEKLFALQDAGYREFHAKLMPEIDKESIIGVRVPNVRALAKELGREMSEEQKAAFFAELPHTYYEENNLHAFLLEREKDIDTCLARVDAFLPYVDNWATCDSMNPKIFAKHPEKLMANIDRWLASEHTYAIRFAMDMLMGHFLDERFTPQCLEKVASVSSEEYYIRMMQAWYFATALAKQESATLPYIEQRRLEKWTHNKAIQKAIESRRITDEMKDYLRTLKVK